MLLSSGRDQPEEWVQLEFSVIGSHLQVKADDKFVGEIDDTVVIDSGEMNIHAQRSGHFRDIEYVPRDP